MGLMKDWERGERRLQQFHLLLVISHSLVSCLCVEVTSLLLICLFTEVHLFVAEHRNQQG